MVQVAEPLPSNAGTTTKKKRKKKKLPHQLDYHYQLDNLQTKDTC
jgi:hypothetical protein